jgi:NAD(P)H-nitrite reductase large subunit
LPAADVLDGSTTDDDILCYCEWLTREQIVAAIPHVRTLKELRETTRACTTCFGCEGDLDELVAEHADRFGTALG